jgi:uncharacterized membrane protein YcaP (DUF421 family)
MKERARDWWKRRSKRLFWASCVLALLLPAPGHEGFDSYTPLGFVVGYLIGEIRGFSIESIIWVMMLLVVSISISFLLVSLVSLGWFLLRQASSSPGDLPRKQRQSLEE